MEYIVNLLFRLRFTVIGLYGAHTLVQALLKITEPSSSLQKRAKSLFTRFCDFYGCTYVTVPYSPIYNHKCENNRLAIYGEKRKRVMTNRLAT